MPIVVGIRFKDSGKIYYFEPNSLDDLVQGDAVIVETVRGPELAKVAYIPRHVDESEIVGELKPVLRRAEQADFERMRLLNERHTEVLARCGEKVQEHSLPMRLVKAEYSFDGSRLTFYFTAEKRVDFRLLVRDLARTFKTRIELRQIGPRDEAKLLGGIGPCGRLLCCATFLPDYARVSIKMAKDQDLPLNPSKISGVCGRLLCCLAYEHEQYLTIKAELPRKGSWVQTPDGPGEVVAINVVRETVTVALGDTGVQEEYTPAQVQEATQRVGGVARQRREEGITPAGPPEGRPRREPKHGNERRLLRDEIESAEGLDSLGLLDDKETWYEPPYEQPMPPARNGPARPATKPGEQRQRPQQQRGENGRSETPRGEQSRSQPVREEQPTGEQPATTEARTGRRRASRAARATMPTPLPKPPRMPPPEGSPLTELPPSPDQPLAASPKSRAARRRRKRGGGNQGSPTSEE